MTRQDLLEPLGLAEERLQVTRALRSEFGAQLSSVIHRARRIAATEPDLARAEMADLIGTARSALAEEEATMARDAKKAPRAQYGALLVGVVVQLV
ncbi:hypothetical protein ACFXKC_45510 [Streptomyces sp. NPDC059340]|uniref:hypothetical protein n=1 Tax=Streptomyces sp. NPDC059340 TaxID=3346806 RepID=UPI0036B24387